MISIACIGQGFVGSSLAQVFAERDVDVLVYDKAGKRAPGVNPHHCDSVADLVGVCESAIHLSYSDWQFSYVYFVAVPTPMHQNGSCDLSILEGVLDELFAAPPGQKPRIAVIKSTVPPGTCERFNKKYGTKLRIVHNPEFLREATALADTRNQTHVVLGGPQRGLDAVEAVYNATFPGVPVIRTDNRTSETVKYVANTYLSVKVSYANEVYQIASKLGIDYDAMIKIATLDKRLGDWGWKVPGDMVSDDGSGEKLFGFGGSCFPKDINAFIRFAKKLGVKPLMLEAAWKKNLEVRPGRDWEHLKGRAVSEGKVAKLSKASALVGMLLAVISSFKG